MRLFILGNGYDIYHNKKTSYKNIYNEIKEKNRDNYEEISSLIDLETDQSFEESLTHLNKENFRFLYRRLGLSEETIEKVYQEFCDNIIKALRNNDTSVSKCLPFDDLLTENDFILNFNFTQTVEQVFELKGIKNYKKLCYIHGSAAEKIARDFYGNNKQEAPSFGPKKLEGNITFDEEVFNQLVRKNTKFFIEKNIWFFDKLRADRNNIQEIVIFGHSCSEVDYDYFLKVAEVLPNAKWSCIYYDDLTLNNFIEYERRLKRAGYNILYKLYLLEDYLLDH